MHGGVFEESMGLDFFIELCAAEEKIIMAVSFARAGGASGAGGGVASFTFVREAAAERGFS